MISPSELMKRMGAGGRLVAFFKAVCVYFAVGGGSPSAGGAAAKCAPVVCLAVCVAVRAREQGARRRYARLVGAGLALSAAGDALLVWPQHFVAGMAAFAAAHVAYICAFGLRPRAAWLGAASAAAAGAFAGGVLAPPAALRRPVLAYALLLAAMAWRGAARPGPQRAGALLFLLSDALLGYSLFAGDLPYKQVLVMSTYYLAQLSIALSALQPSSPAAPALSAAPATPASPAVR